MSSCVLLIYIFWFEIYLLRINDNFYHCTYHTYIYFFILFKKSKTILQFFYHYLFYNLILFKNWRTTCAISSTISSNWLRFVKSDRVISEKRKKEKKDLFTVSPEPHYMIVKLNVNSMSVKTSEMFISGPNCHCWARIKPPRRTRFKNYSYSPREKRKDHVCSFRRILFLSFQIANASIFHSNIILKLHEILYCTFLHKINKNQTWELIFVANIHYILRYISFNWILVKFNILLKQTIL